MSIGRIKGEWGQFTYKGLKKRLERLDSGTCLSSHASFLMKREKSRMSGQLAS